MSQRKLFHLTLLVLLTATVVCWHSLQAERPGIVADTPSTTAPYTTPSPSTHLFVPVPQTKFSDCIVNGKYPDNACTPGAIFTGVTSEQVCTPGYAKGVRNVPESEKKQVYSEYGIISHAPGQYEVDHFISLELGGSNDSANLFPEAAEPRPGFHEKDKVENYLHEQVCSGAITLNEAQREIATDWYTIYQQIILR